MIQAESLLEVITLDNEELKNVVKVHSRSLFAVLKLCLVPASGPSQGHQGREEQAGDGQARADHGAVRLQVQIDAGAHGSRC